MSKDSTMKRGRTRAMLALLEEMLAIPSPPGREEQMAALLRAKLSDLGLRPETDPARNLLVRFPGSSDAKPLVIAAHMDEIALTVSHIEADGRLQVVRSGGMSPHKLGERMVQILGDRGQIAGVVSGGAGHGADPSAAGDWQNYRVATGLTPAQLEAAGIHPGAAIVPAADGRGPLIFGDPADPLVAAWTFDDRMGMVLLLEVIRSLVEAPAAFPFPVVFAFTVHEEGGCHGAKNLCRLLQPDVFIGIDGCPVTTENQLALDGRPAVWVKDRFTNYDICLQRGFAAAAKAAGVRLQYAVFSNANSDASAAYETGHAGRVALFGHVRDNSHGFEFARLAVFENARRALEEFVRNAAQYARPDFGIDP